MMSFERTSSFFCSSPWTFVSPARPTLWVREMREGMGMGDREDGQVYETGFPDVGGDELGSDLDGGEEEGEIASCGRAETKLVAEDMSAHKGESETGAWRGAYRVRVMRSVLGCSSAMARERKR
jgi:hypothetical protein